MSWNRSSNSQQTETALRRSGTPRPTVERGVIAGAVVLLGAAVAAWWLWPSEETRQDAASTKRGMIREATPAAAPKPVAESQSPEDAERAERRRKARETYVDEHGVTRYKRGNGRVLPKNFKDYLVESKSFSNLPKFNHECELEIATLLTLEPGDAILGEFDHGERFKKDFVEALLDPVKIEEGDSEDDKRIKLEVEDAKKELAQRLKQGEDIGKILEETRSEYQRLNAVREQVREQMRELMRENAQTDQDIDDFLSAANKMLESKGLAPIKMNAFMRKKIKKDMEGKNQ